MFVLVAIKTWLTSFLETGMNCLSANTSKLKLPWRPRWLCLYADDCHSRVPIPPKRAIAQSKRVAVIGDGTAVIVGSNGALWRIELEANSRV